VRSLAIPPSTAVSPPLVLIVDDGPDATSLYREYLEFCGFRVILAPSLHAVLDAQANVPDIIVLDLTTPCVDASETIRQLKAHPRTADIPLVALSGGSHDDAIRGRAAGADVCLPKPCVPSQVARAIRALLVWQRSRPR
jgi:DNA-binding response OmpR family regulator